MRKMKVRWSARGNTVEKVVDVEEVRALGGQGSGTFVAFVDNEDEVQLLIPGGYLIDAVAVDNA